MEAQLTIIWVQEEKLLSNTMSLMRVGLLLPAPQYPLHALL